MRYIVEQGQITGSRQKIVLSGCSLARRETRLISVPTAQTDPGGDSAIRLTMYSVEPASSAASTTSCLHSGWTITRTPGWFSRAQSIWARENRAWTEHQPSQSTNLAASISAAE